MFVLLIPLLIGVLFLGETFPSKIIRNIGLVFLLIFIYSFLIEPFVILEQEVHYPRKTSLVESKSKIKLAILSDFHLGFLKDQGFLKRVVNKVNHSEADLVVILGDFIWQTLADQKLDWAEVFKPLSQLKVPIYAVWGNHDQALGVSSELVFFQEILAGYGVKFLIDQEDLVNISGQQLSLLGLSDLSFSKNNPYFSGEKALKNKEADLKIVLTHNPDTSYYLHNSNQFDLLLAGHTHGGQIRIPWLFKFIIPTKFDFDRGWYQVKGLTVFVGTGLGESLLPLRFLMPPTIYYLNI